MIIVSLRGGLGNQMFQYVCGLAVARRLNTELKLDLSLFHQFMWDPNYTKREFELDSFKITAKHATTEEIKMFCPISVQNSKFDNFFYYAKRAITNRHLLQEKIPLVYDKRIESIVNNTYLLGYWQSELYFKNLKPLIQQEFSLKKEVSPEAKHFLNLIENQNSVSIHIRRGDYLKEGNVKIHGIISENYYRQAIEVIRSKVNNPYFFIFTDDIAWVKNNFIITAPFMIFDKKNSANYEEIWLMSRCKHHIIANSSFSWWGAWLNSSVEKIVIAPHQWVVNMPENANNIPSGWIKL